MTNLDGKKWKWDTKGEGRGLFCNSCLNKLSVTVTVTVTKSVMCTGVHSLTQTNRTQRQYLPRMMMIGTVTEMVYDHGHDGSKGDGHSHSHVYSTVREMVTVTVTYIAQSERWSQSPDVDMSRTD